MGKQKHLKMSRNEVKGLQISNSRLPRPFQGANKRQVYRYDRVLTHEPHPTILSLCSEKKRPQIVPKSRSAQVITKQPRTSLGLKSGYCSLLFPLNSFRAEDLQAVQHLEFRFIQPPTDDLSKTSTIHLLVVYKPCHQALLQRRRQNFITGTPFVFSIGCMTYQLHVARASPQRLQKMSMN